MVIKRGGLMVFLFFLLVVGILLTLIPAKPSQEKPSKTQLDINLLDRAIKSYFEELDKYPSADNGLAVLFDKNLNAPLLNKSELLVDEWGRNYVYRSPAICSNKEYEIYSLGANGVDECGLADDVIYK